MSVLALVTMMKGLVPRWRGGLNWGRSARLPVSGIGHAGLTLAFGVIGAGSIATALGVGGELALISPFAGFVIFIATGLFDGRQRGPR